MKKLKSEILAEYKNRNNLDEINPAGIPLVKVPAKKQTKARTFSLLSATDEIEKSYSIDDTIIIGVTGSVGKSSVAYLIHEYLVYAGYKSILYSSLKVDSPTSFIRNDKTFEGSLSEENQFVNVINQAEAAMADFVVLEVSEEALRKGALANIHFDLKILTTFYKDWVRQIPTEVYLSNKISFFNDDEDSIILLNLNSTRFNDFFAQSIGQKVIVDSAIVDEYDKFFERRRLPELLDKTVYPNYHCVYGIGGLKKSLMQFKLNSGEEIEIETKLTTYYSLQNLLITAAALDAINIFNKEVFSKFCNKEDLNVSGRLETIEFKNGSIVIDYDIMNAYPCLKEMKDGECDVVLNKYQLKRSDFFNHDINRIVAVGGPVASSNMYLKKWAFANTQYDRTKHPIGDYSGERKYTTFGGVISKNADKCYLTVDSPGDRNALDIVTEVAPYITIPTICVPDRKEAIRKAVSESLPGDVIVITGRGDRRTFFTTNEEFEFFSDKDIVLKTIKELEEGS